MLRRVMLKGFKSIKEVDVELRPLNVLIGANGAGKSNFVSFFKMLNEIIEDRLQEYVGKSGRAHSLLYFGPKVTSEIEAELTFVDATAYCMHLSYAAVDTLVFVEETQRVNAFGVNNGYPMSIHTRGQETGLNYSAITQEIIRATLKGCQVYHFNDTAPTARIRQYGYVGDNHRLLSDAGNLAAYLLRLRNEPGGAAYLRIVNTVRLVAPFFDDFDLEPVGPQRSEVILNWREKGSDQVFGPHQFSDGTLRAICLITLLLQPENELPALIIVDEPEIGLHPYALNVIAALFEKASHHRQVIVSTQSSSFLDNFDPEDVIVVNREGQSSKFERLNETALESWLEEYSLGEVWEKNVIGGGPH
jgi:predicted ATPase